MVATRARVRRKWLFALVRDVQVLGGFLLDELRPVTIEDLESTLATLHPPSNKLEELVVKGFAADVLAHAAPSQKTDGGSAAASDVLSPKVAHAKKLLDADYAGPWNLERLSRAVQWNRTTLAKAFKAEVGVSIHRYLMSRRISVARERLAYTDDKIAAIALDVGFSHATFERTFRRLAGMSPSMYRALMQRGRRPAMN